MQKANVIHQLQAFFLFPYKWSRLLIVLSVKLMSMTIELRSQCDKIWILFYSKNYLNQNLRYQKKIMIFLNFYFFRSRKTFNQSSFLWHLEQLIFTYQRKKFKVGHLGQETMGFNSSNFSLNCNTLLNNLILSFKYLFKISTLIFQYKDLIRNEYQCLKWFGNTTVRIWKTQQCHDAPVENYCSSI